MHTNMHVVFVSVECGMHTGYTYKYVYIRVLLLNPYAGYFNHAYECEGKRMAQAALIDMQVQVDRHTMDGYHACMPFSYHACMPFIQWMGIMHARLSYNGWVSCMDAFDPYAYALAASHTRHTTHSISICPYSSSK